MYPSCHLVRVRVRVQGEGGGGEGDGGGGEGDGGGGEGDGGGGEGEGGGRLGDGGGSAGGELYRRPQSSQSVPNAHVLPSASGCPSWQCLLLAYFGPPTPKRLRQVFSHTYGKWAVRMWAGVKFELQGLYGFRH